jgi:hypothetical protein
MKHSVVTSVVWTLTSLFSFAAMAVPKTELVPVENTKTVKVEQALTSQSGYKILFTERKGADAFSGRGEFIGKGNDFYQLSYTEFRQFQNGDNTIISMSGMDVESKNPRSEDSAFHVTVYSKGAAKELKYSCSSEERIYSLLSENETATLNESIAAGKIRFHKTARPLYAEPIFLLQTENTFYFFARSRSDSNSPSVQTLLFGPAGSMKKDKVEFFETYLDGGSMRLRSESNTISVPPSGRSEGAKVNGESARRIKLGNFNLETLGIDPKAFAPKSEDVFGPCSVLK